MIAFDNIKLHSYNTDDKRTVNMEDSVWWQMEKYAQCYLCWGKIGHCLFLVAIMLNYYSVQKWKVCPAEIWPQSSRDLTDDLIAGGEYIYGWNANRCPWLLVERVKLIARTTWISLQAFLPMLAFLLNGILTGWPIQSYQTLETLHEESYPQCISPSFPAHLVSIYKSIWCLYYTVNDFPI